MKLVLYNDYIPGVLKDDRVVDISHLVATVPHIDGTTLMSGLIADFAQYSTAISKATETADGLPVDQVRLRAPLPSPGKIVCMAVNYMENGTRKLPADREAFIKSSSAVIGPGDTIILPDCPADHFHHEAELGVVIGKTTSKIRAIDALDHVFGYVNFIDVSARGINPNGNNSFFWGKSWDTFAPMGPAIVTKDEITDPQNLNMKLWVSGELRQDLSTSDMGRSIAEVIEFISWVTTLNPGDVIATGTNHIGLAPIQNGDSIHMEIEGLGKLSLNVRDDWNRSWPNESLSKMTPFESSIRAKVVNK